MSHDISFRRRRPIARATTHRFMSCVVLCLSQKKAAEAAAGAQTVKKGKGNSKGGTSKAGGDGTMQANEGASTTVLAAGTMVVGNSDPTKSSDPTKGAAAASVAAKK